MPETQPEPLAAILAEMRNPPHKWEGFSRADLAALADRIEAAAKREYEEAKAYFEKLHDGPSMICTAKSCAVRNVGLAIANAAPGNAAALRAALERAIDAIQTMIALYDEEHTAAVKTGATWKRSDTSAVDEIVEQARAALAAPARNCDRFATVKDAGIAFARERKDQPLPCPDFTFSAWLFAPAEGGGAK